MSEELHADAWVNAMAEIGTSRDKTAEQNSLFIGAPLESDTELSDLYYGNAICHKICAKIPELIAQAGYDLKCERSADARLFAKSIGLDEKIQECGSLARAFGGSALLFLTDAKDPSKPLNLDKERIIGAVAIDRRFLQVLSYCADLSSPRFREPETVRMSPLPIGMGLVVDSTTIHGTRMAFFYGTKVDPWERARCRGFGHSVLRLVKNKVQLADQSISTLGTLLFESSVGVFKIKDLIARLNGPNKDALIDRMRMTNDLKSVNRSILLDKDGEDYTREASQFNGVPDAIDRVLQYVAGAAEMPMTVLFGISPAGLNATGASDIQQWYDKVSSERSKYALPALLRAYSLIVRALGVMDTSVSIEPGDIHRPTREENQAYRKAVADTDAVYIANDVVQPEAVAIARFGNGYDPQADPQVDVVQLQAALRPTEILPSGGKVELTPSDLAAVVTVKEARASVGQAPLTLPDGSYSPDNDLTVEAFRTKYAASPGTPDAAPLPQPAT